MTSEFDRLTGVLSPEFVLDGQLPAVALGHAYSARSASGEPVRITVLSRDVTRRMSAPERFHGEILRARDLQHASLLPMRTAGVTTAGDVYFATAVPRGRSARELLSRGDSVQASALARYGAAIANGLAAAHRGGQLHAAICPDRVFLGESGAQLAGLGVHAGLLAAGIAPAEAVALMGASTYASPEQLDALPLDERSDVYALGATLYELLTGKPPFGGRTTSVVMASVLADEPTTDMDTGVQLPGHIVDAVLRAIEKAPDDRWMTAQAFAEGLEGRGTEAAEPHVATRRAGCLPRAAAVLLGGSALLAGWLR